MALVAPEVEVAAKKRGPAPQGWDPGDKTLTEQAREIARWRLRAERCIHEAGSRQGIGREQLAIHADRGSAMASKPVAVLPAHLGVTKTHSRAHVSNDNPFSEAQCKTLKYRPAFPERFGSIQDARRHCHVSFPWSRYAGDPQRLC